MLPRIVISFFSSRAGSPSGAYVDRALALKKRANALGATLCAWGSQSFSFDIDADELEEALALCALGREGSPDEQLGAGVAEGMIAAFGEGNAFAVLAWGAPLLAAESLAREARAGEVRLAPAFFATREREMLALGWTALRDGSARCSLGAFNPPPLSPPRSAPVSMSAPRMPTPPRLPVSRFPPPPPVPGTRLASRAEPPPLPSRPPPSFDPVGPVNADDLGRTPSRPSIPVITQARGPLSQPPSELRELAKRALLQGDLPALERLLEQLRSTGEHSELVDRMTGLVALRRGATADALRRLRESAESAKDPGQTARARLAYGVALASAGRMEGALLEVLLALARARAASDTHGEHACALFLARLAVAAGHPGAAPAWAQVAQRCARELAAAGAEAAR